MKKILLLLTVLFPAVAHADCLQIKDRDAKYMCLAKTRNSYNYCLEIKDRDNQYYCRAILGKSSNYCMQIKNSDLKQECLSVTR